MVLLDAVQGVLSIIVMVGIGYFLSYKGWFNDTSSKLFSKLVVNLALPSYMISNLMTTYDKEKLMHLKSGLLIPFVSMLLGYGIAMLIAKAIKIPETRKGTFCSMFALSNTIFIGLPVNLALFGDESLPFVLLYYIANTTLFWTIGVYGISRDGGNKDKRIFTLNNIKRIFSPPLLGFAAAIILILLKVSLPKGLMDVCKYMGNLTTPLSMLFIGIVIYSVNLKDIKFDKEMAILLLGRFIIIPLSVIAICFGLPLPVLMKKVFIIQSSMPAMTQTSIIAEAYNADYKYAAIMTTVTTMASLIFIPLYMIFLTSFKI